MDFRCKYLTVLHSIDDNCDNELHTIDNIILQKNAIYREN